MEYHTNRGPPAEATIKEIDLDFGQQIGEQIWIAADDTTMIDRVCLTRLSFTAFWKLQGGSAEISMDFS